MRLSIFGLFNSDISAFLFSDFDKLFGAMRNIYNALIGHADDHILYSATVLSGEIYTRLKPNDMSFLECLCAGSV